MSIRNKLADDSRKKTQVGHSKVIVNRGNFKEKALCQLYSTFVIMLCFFLLVF